MYKFKQSTAYTIYVLLVDETNPIVGLAGLTPTFTLGKAGGASSGITPTYTDRGSGVYSVELAAGDTDTLGAGWLHITATGAVAHDVFFWVESTDLATIGADVDQVLTNQGSHSTTLSSINTDTNNIEADTQDLQQSMARALGLLQENFMLDNTAFAGSDMTSGRIRIFANAVDLVAASDGATFGTENEIAGYQITVVYESAGKVQSYKVEKL